MALELPFFLINAFTTRFDGGNPAAVIFTKEQSAPDMQKIAANLNQPMTVFVLGSPSINNNAATFDLRFFTPTQEVPICGHGTLAAVEAISQTPNIISNGVKLLKFQTVTAGTLTARFGGGGSEIELPSTQSQEIPAAEQQRLSLIVCKAFGKGNLAIKHMVGGTQAFEGYLMVELDEGEDLADCKVNSEELRATAPYFVNIFTTSSSDGIIFVSRMFAPNAGVEEDQVCGSAHCLLAPYWAAKRNLENEEMRTRQVSARGGDLEVVWDAERNIIKLRGKTKVWARGTLLV